MADALERARENLVGVVGVLVLGLGAVGMVTGAEWFLLVWVVGFTVVVPLVALLFGDGRDADGSARTRTDESTETSEDADAALEALRERYARGELTDEQFERKVERLLETETVESATDAVRERERETR